MRRLEWQENISIDSQKRQDSLHDLLVVEFREAVG
jgi:hypothetical protein